MHKIQICGWSHAPETTPRASKWTKRIILELALLNHDDHIHLMSSCYELSSLYLLGASGFWTFQKLAVQELKQTGPYLPRRLEGGQSSGGKGPQNLA